MADNPHITPIRTGVPPKSLAWSPAGDMLAVGSVDGIVHICNLNGDVLRTLKRDTFTAHIEYIEWHPSGEYLIATSFHSNACVWDIKDGRLLAVINAGAVEPYANITHIHWCPSQQLQIAYISAKSKCACIVNIKDVNTPQYFDPL